MGKSGWQATASRTLWSFSDCFVSEPDILVVRSSWLVVSLDLAAWRLNWVYVVLLGMGSTVEEVQTKGLGLC